MPPPSFAAAAPADPDEGGRGGWTMVVEADLAFFRSHGSDVTGDLTFPDDVSAQQIALRGAEIVVGRRNEARGYHPEIDLSDPLNDPAVSRRHAVLRRAPGGSWTLVDQHSANGTWVNGTPVEPGRSVPLHDGDCLNLGAFTVLRMHRDGGATA